jgi:hypothetical protein
MPPARVSVGPRRDVCTKSAYENRAAVRQTSKRVISIVRPVPEFDVSNTSHP